jgi:glycosyltransferase involved in cell wall biosynthesis
MRRILFISWWWPYPADNGSKIRIYNLLRHLSQQYHVALVSFAEADEAQPEQVEHLRGLCESVDVIPKPHFDPAGLKALLGYFSHWPRSLVDTYTTEMEQAIQRVAAERPVDLMIASELGNMRYLEVLPGLPGILEEAQVAIARSAVEQASGTASRLRAEMTLAKTESAIRHLMNRGVVVTTASETEEVFLRHFAPAGAAIKVIPNGVDTQLHRPDPAVEPQANSLIYTGAVTYYANYDAVAYFVREVWPLVRQRSPEARFTVTGSTRDVDVSDLAAEPGVHFSGYLPSVADAVRQHWALVVPLLSGGGTRLKILEAMALGTPVISTRKGAEGIHARSDEHLLIADSPAEMADAVCRLLADPALRARLSQAGRALVEQEYDWSVIGGQLVNVIERTLAGRSPH